MALASFVTRCEKLHDIMEVLTITELNHILFLNDPKASKKAFTGGKASNLTILANAGFNVPKGFVITTDAYRSFVKENGIQDIGSMYLKEIPHDDTLGIKQTSEVLRKKIQEAVLPETLVNEIKIAYTQIGGGPVAVRSSATAEDLPDASFAGQYDSSLNIVGLEDVLEQIKHCFGSIWTTRAISYREENRIHHENVRVAVIVQSMVDAKSAGVMFTKSPLYNTDNEIMIESNFGLGESVVSGYTVPDRFIVQYRINDEAPFCLISREIGTKEIIVLGNLKGQGVMQSKNDCNRSQLSSLNDDEIIRLAEIGKSIEDYFGAPQDIEWAIDKQEQIHLLQSRHITVDWKRENQVKDNVFWTRGYSDDYWNDPVTPLFFSLLGDQITYIVNNEANAIMGYRDMSKELLKLYKGHAYFNLDVLKMKVINEMPPFIRSDDVMNYFPEGAGPYGKETMRRLPFAIKNRIMAEIRVMLFDGDGSMSKTNEVYERWTEEEFNPACKTFDDEFKNLNNNGSAIELMEIADDLDKTMMKHFRLVRYGLPVHTLGMNLITNYLLKRWLGERAAIVFYPLLLSGVEHKTSETNKRIEGLASLIRKDDDLCNFILSTPSNEILGELHSLNSSMSKVFLESFNKFTDDFGDRGFTREPYYPRWQESPERVFDVLKSLVSEGAKDLREAEMILSRRRNSAEKFVRQIIRNQRFGPLKWKLFSTILGMARTYTGFRENQRFNLDRWISRERKAYLEIGKRLVKEEFFDEPEQVFFLYRYELRKLLREPSTFIKKTIKSLVRERHEEFLKYENTTPPKFLQGNREFDDPLPESAEGYKGIPASQGILTGKVRVLNSVEDVPQVKAGEILVVPRTDPGWTPVFSKIGGLITETGGILSHGAVVSREFGIPAVTNIRNACQVFKTGQKVTIDGNEGVVILQEKESE
ncbi:hypothetical protein EU527_04180 [Candidatus Thorarchaeota archaeon]|nr:MAG: hypothetical protein EU527_04180 [Candidatus Thorarchaeota archaeon]